MTQQNCRPCQGLESLTPLLPRNRAGQSSLNYRVGTYNEFFQSMLAGLSRGRTATANLKSPLRLLTAREKDDPSIAMLDAWAILADVLTFYNERYIDETFLRTATQASSLHELANLVGYLPRPGLSSSVYLAFEVDDRGSEVLIPKGTPARSTPIPGSGETSETFETSADFIARPSFNKIQPRLSRPHDLTPSGLAALTDLYLKGIGLRIQPNDYIAIGTNEIGAPVLKKVISVTEKRETVRGPVTVLNLELETLAPSSLINEIENHVAKFLEFSDIANLVDSTTAKQVKDAFQSVIDELYGKGRPSGITGTDKLVNENLLKDMLLSGSTSTLRNVVNLANVNLYKDPGSLSAFARDEYAARLKAFKDTHANIRDEIEDRKTLVDNIDFDRNDTTKVLAVESLLYSIESATAAQPKVFHALKRDVAPGTGPLFPAVLFSPFTPPAGDTFDVTFKSVSGTITAPNQSGDPWANVTSGISNAQGTNVHYALFTVVNQTGEHIVAGVQKFTTNSAVIKNLIVEQTSFFRSQPPPHPLDDFTCTSGSTETDFSFAITKLEGNGTFGTVVPVTGNIGNVISQIKGLTFTPGPPGSSRDTVLITITKNGADVAYALRSFVFDGKPIYVRSLLAELLRGSKNLDVIKTQLLNDYKHVSTVPKPETDTLEKMGLASHQLKGQIRGDKFDSEAETINDARTTLIDGMSGIGTSIKTKLGGTPDPMHIFKLDKVRDAATALETTDPSGARSNGDYALLGMAYRQLLDACNSAKSRAQLLLDTFIQLLKSTQASLNERRELVVHRLELSAIEGRKPIEGTTAGSADEEIKNKLVDAFAVDKTDSFRFRLKKSAEPIGLDTTSAVIDGNKATMSEIGEEIVRLVDEISGRLGELSAAGAASIGQMLDAWKKTEDIIKLKEDPPQPNTSNSITSIADLLNALQRLESPAASKQSVVDILSANSAMWPQVLAALDPQARGRLLSVLRGYRYSATAAQGNVKTWVFRSQANLFGWNSPGKSFTVTEGTSFIARRTDMPVDFPVENKLENGIIILDGKAAKTLPDTPLAVRTPGSPIPSGYWAEKVQIAPRTAFGVSNDSTRIEIADGATWFGTADNDFGIIRNSKVFCDAELLELAEVLLTDTVEGYLFPDTSLSVELELDGFFPELSAPSIISVAGLLGRIEEFGQNENGAQGSHSYPVAELARVIDVRHLPPTRNQEAIHTSLSLSAPLGYRYRRDSASICANVVEATHGETVVETLGNGDARKPFQRFRLSRAPLTRLPAVTPSGKQEALEVHVNQTKWDQEDQLVAASPHSESYELRGNRQDATTTVQFGDGEHGARLPTGIENVKATYRVGLGAAGNVASGQINQLPSPPFGVKSVTNPLSGDGGTDADTVSQTRVRISALPASIGRIVSKRDYENFALLFAGIDKVAVDDQNGQLVIFVAGPSPAPLLATGQLLTNLTRALAELGDPDAQVEIKPHTGLLLHIKAKVSVDARHEWAPVAEAINRALLDRFGYTSAILGKDILASEVVNTIQSVEKVNYVVLEELLGLASSEKPGHLSDSRRTSRSPGGGTPTSQPALKRVDVFIDEVCYIDSKVSSTVQLERI